MKIQICIKGYYVWLLQYSSYNLNMLDGLAIRIYKIESLETIAINSSVECEGPI